MSAFQRHLDKEHSSYKFEFENPKLEDELILEFGFNLFILINILVKHSENNSTQETGIDLIYKSVNEFHVLKDRTNDSIFANLGVITSLIKLATNLVIELYSTIEGAA